MALEQPYAKIDIILMYLFRKTLVRAFQRYNIHRHCTKRSSSIHALLFPSIFGAKFFFVRQEFAPFPVPRILHKTGLDTDMGGGGVLY